MEQITPSNNRKCKYNHNRKLDLKNRLINKITFKIYISDYYGESRLYIFHFDTVVGYFHNNSNILNDVIAYINEAFYDSHLNLSTNDIKYSKPNKHGSNFTCFDINSEIIPKLKNAIDSNKHFYENLFVYFYED